jgi:hypothetical protein
MRALLAHLGKADFLGGTGAVEDFVVGGNDPGDPLGGG